VSSAAKEERKQKELARRARRRERLLLAVLLGAVFFQEFCSARLLNASSDETMHLPAGYTYWKTGDFRLNPEHPPFIKLLAALPLLPMNPYVKWEDPTWSGDPPDQVRFGVRFLYSSDPVLGKGAADRMLFWGRTPVMLLSVLLGWYVFLWARDLYGARAGLAALFLYAFCPNILAHSRFVTMDLGLSCFFVMTAFYVWRFSRSGGRRNAALAGVSLGLALATKFSAIILLPTVAVLLGMAVAQRQGGKAEGPRPDLDEFPAVTNTPRRILLAARAYALMIAVSFTLVWAIFFFPKNPFFYLEGMWQVNENHVKEYWSYLAGNFRQGGWKYYFLAVFLLKTPPPTLILFVLSAVLWKVLPRMSWKNEGFLLVPGVFFFVFTTLLADDIGVRYILPIYPLVYIFAARLTDFLLSKRWRAAAAGVLGAWLVFGTVRMYPDYLAYFTDFVGGAANGHKYLDDSNIDWGTDFRRLKEWMDDHGVEKIRLYTPWATLPGYYGIKFEWWEFLQENPAPPGLYAISTHSLVRGLLAARMAGMNTDWLFKYKPVDRVGYGFYIFKFE
jgi:hypothetical protein